MDKLLRTTLFQIILWSLSFSAFANIEGASQYYDKKEVESFIESRSSAYLSQLEELESQNLVCEFDYLRFIRSTYRSFSINNETEILEALKYLRFKSIIDDTEFRLVSKSVRSFEESLKYKFSAPLYNKVKDFKANAFSHYARSVSKKGCYNNIFSKLISDLGKTKSSKIKSQLKTAYHKKMIDRKNYWMLKRLVQDDYHKESQNLFKYKRTQEFLNKQFPERADISASDYISKREDKSELSRREILLSKYNQFQLVYMREMIEKLLNRLNADEVRINVVLDDYVMETIILDPMEQYRFAAKMIRKELGDLQNKSLFSKSQVSFGDLIAAAYETALIPGEDLEALSLVEEVWNPELTKVEKRKKFIKRYGTIFVAALPTSIYFVKVLSLVGIEMLTEVKEEPSRDHSLF